MSDKKATQDELLILLRDTYLDINNLLNKLRDVFFDNLDEIVNALVHQQTEQQNSKEK